MATCNTDESSEEEGETFNMMDKQGPSSRQNLTTVEQCSDGSQSEPKAMPPRDLPRDLPVVSLRGDAQVDQTQTDARIISEVLARNEITEEQWLIFKETDAVMAINDHFNGEISEYTIQEAIVEFVKEKGHMRFKAKDLMMKIPGNCWN